MTTFSQRQPFRAAWPGTLGLLLGLVTVVMLLAGCGATPAGEETSPASVAPATTATTGTSTVATFPVQSTQRPKRSAAGDLIPQTRLAELPVEAAETIDLILAAGPFPFERDGAVFGNFEQRLPAAGSGAYREYTVITPGADDRGARRIVTDNDETEFYYTDDHYESFSEVILP